MTTLSENKKLAISMLWVLLGVIASKGLLLISIILVAQIIDIDEYGRVGIIRSLIVTASMFSLASFGLTATKYLMIYKSKSIDKANNILNITRFFTLILSLLILVALLLSSSYIGETHFEDSDLATYIQVAAISVFFTSLNGYQLGVLAGYEEFKKISIVNITSGIFSFPIILIMANMFGGIGVIWGITFLSIITWALSYVLIRKINGLELRLSIPHLNKESKDILWKFSLPMFLSGLVVAPVTFFSQAYIVNQTSGYLEIAIYTAAFNLTLISLTVTQVISQVLYPYVMKYFSNKDVDFSYVNIVFPWLVSLVINIPIILFPDYFSLLYTPEYHGDQFNKIAIIVALSTIILSYKQGIARNFAAANMMWWSVASNFFWGGTCLVFLWLLSGHGALGLALSFLFAHVIGNLAFLPLYIRNNLIDKRLLLSYRSILIWFLIAILPLFYFFNASLPTRVFMFLLIITFIFVIGINWYKEETKHYE